MDIKSNRVLTVILVITMVIVMAAGLTACGGSSDTDNKTALELFNEAGNKLNDADSYSSESDTEITTSIADQSIEIDSESDIKQVNNGGDIELEVITKSDTAGVKSELKSYYKDGYYYYESEGRKMKMQMDVDSAMSQANNSIFEIPEDTVKTQSVTDEDGGKELHLVLDGTKLLDEATGLLGDLSKYGSIANDTTVGDMDITAFVDGDGNLKDTEIKFTANLTVQDQATKVDFVIDMEVTKIGGVTIDFPADLDSYSENAV